MSRFRLKKLADRSRPIDWEDANAGTYFASLDTSGQGRVSRVECKVCTATTFNAIVAEKGQVGTYLTKFNEFKYFKGVGTALDNGSNGCNLARAQDTATADIKLTEITLPKQLTNINGFNTHAGFAFFTMAKFVIPENLTYIATHSFKGANITKVIVSSISQWLAITFGVPQSGYDISASALAEGGDLYIGNDSVNAKWDGVVPSGTTTIGAETFAMKDLTDITLPDSIVSIGYGAFANAKALTTLTKLPSSLTTLGMYAFKDSVVPISAFPNGLTTIPDYCFQNDTGVNFSSWNNVSEIGIGAFQGCTALKVNYIPNSYTSPKKSVFYGCSGLTDMTIPDSWTTIPDTFFRNCTNLKLSALPSGLKVVDYQAFYECTSGVMNLTMPSSIVTLGMYAFYRCNGLALTWSDASNLETLNSYAFQNCESLNCSLPVFSKLTVFNPYVFNNSGAKGTVSAPLVTNVMNGAFESSKIEEVDLPECTQVLAAGFRACTSLTKVDMPKCTDLGISAFEGCTTLNDTTFATGGLTSVAKETFKNCSQLQSVEFADTLTEITESCFLNCVALQSVPNEENITKIGKFGLCNCDALTTVNLPKIQDLVYRCFYDCGGITSITFGNELTHIGNQCFRNTSNLTSLTLPASLTTIDSEGLSYMSKSLTEIGFEGTMAQWEAISKGSNWHSNSNFTKICCSDGDITL